MKRHSSRADIAPFLAMEMAREADRRAQAGERIVRFDVGQPFVGAPVRATDAVREALGKHVLGYSGGLGLMSLRRKISAHYRAKHDLDIPAERIVVTTGASGAFTLAFLALFDSGDRVALASPGYPPYRHILTALGMRPALIAAQQNEKFQLAPHHLDELAAQGPLAGALVASPANPTGSALSLEELRALAAKARALNCALVSDEIYHGLSYGAPTPSALAVDDDVIVVNSFSKYWAMTGWRVGWIVAPEALIAPIERLAQNLTIGPPTPSQIAAAAALDADDECEERRAVYAANRRVLLEALPKIGLAPVAPPDGAFYMLLDISAHDADSAHFCQRALDEIGVALTAGRDFDEARGAHWVRLAFARETAEVEDGVARLARWLA